LPRGASGGLAHELPCDADATKPQLVDFLRFLDQDVSSTDRSEVSRTDCKNLALPLIRGETDPRQRGQRRAAAITCSLRALISATIRDSIEGKAIAGGRVPVVKMGGA
jgi:hypothetical protein